MLNPLFIYFFFFAQPDTLKYKHLKSDLVRCTGLMRTLCGSFKEFLIQGTFFLCNISFISASSISPSIKNTHMRYGLSAPPQTCNILFRSEINLGEMFKIHLGAPRIKWKVEAMLCCCSSSYTYRLFMKMGIRNHIYLHCLQVIANAFQGKWKISVTKGEKSLNTALSI